MLITIYQSSKSQTSTFTAKKSVLLDNISFPYVSLNELDPFKKLSYK